MVGEDRVMMSGKELRRVHVIRQAMEKRITQVKAGALLGLTATPSPSCTTAGLRGSFRCPGDS